MKNLLFILSLLVLSIQLPLSGQTFSASSQKGCDKLTVKFNYTGSIAVTNYKWTFGDGEESTEESPQHEYLNPGNYLVSLKINDTDSSGIEEFIKIGRTPKAEFNYHDTLEVGTFKIAFNPVKQQSSPFLYIYSWEVEGNTGNTPSFYYQFDSAGIYTTQLIISDVLGCADTIVKSIEVLNKLAIPNVFTPNDDGLNDLFIIQGDNQTTYSIQIFSRSGIKVFETDAKVIVWDGRTFSGDTVRDGIYYYVIESLDSPVLVKQSGFFYLYR